MHKLQQNNQWIKTEKQYRLKIFDLDIIWAKRLWYSYASIIKQRLNLWAKSWFRIS